MYIVHTYYVNPHKKSKYEEMGVVGGSSSEVHIKTLVSEGELSPKTTFMGGIGTTAITYIVSNKHTKGFSSKKSYFPTLYFML